MGDADEAIDILAVGDVYINRADPRAALAQVEDRFAAADLRIGNLESAVTDEGTPGDMIPDTLVAPPETIDGLTHAGFDILGIANNHTTDFGDEALVDTIERLEAHGIEYSGGGRNAQEAREPGVVDVNGLRVGLLAFEATQLTLKLLADASPESPGLNMIDVSPLYPDPHVDRTDVAELERTVASVSENVDVLIAMFHFGAGHGQTHTIPQRALSRAAIDAGADAVVGSHAHVVQGAESYESAPILYGLGHFFWDPFYEDKPHLDEHSFTRDTVVASLTATRDGVESARLYPAYITEAADQPTVLSPDSAAYERIADTIATISSREGTELVRHEDCLEVPL